MIILILLLAIVLRLVNLNQSLWLDEAVQAVTAQKSVAFIWQEIVGDFHPPAYHLLLNFWAGNFGSSEIALRIPSVLFGVGTVWLVYKIAQKLITNYQLLAALFMATAPFHIYYSQEARMYSMACFFATLSMFYFFQINELIINGLTNYKNKIIIFWAISASFLIYSDYFGFLVILAQFVILLWQKKFRFLFFCLFTFLLIFIPWLPMFLVQLKTGMAATHSLPGWSKLVNLSFFRALPITFFKFTLGRITIFDKRLYVLTLAFLLIFYGFLAIKAIKSNLKESKGGPGLIIGWLGVPVLFAWVSSLFIPNYQPFRLLLVLPAFYLLLVLGISSLKGKSLHIPVAILILTINVLSLAKYYFNPYFHREDWRGLVNYLKAQEGSAALLPSETSNWPVKYYDSKNKIQIVYGNMGISKLNELTDYENVYYVRYLVPVFDPEENILEWLKQLNFYKTQEISFNQISVWKFQPAQEFPN